MANFVFANNIKTTVASAFSNVATSLTLASSVGLPTLSAGQVLPITLQDAATGLVYEICYATAITGATLTVTRAQEGTAAQNWSVGDRAYCAPTALSVAPVNGNGLNVFQVANAVAANEAVNLGQAQADFLAIGGNAVSATYATSSGTAANGTPVGTVIDFGGTAAPTGYLACPVAAGGVGLLARTGTYAALFAAIGTTWGAGDGSTTFQMPWFPADYASVQANANVGTDTVGAVIAHTHTQSYQLSGQAGAGVPVLGSTLGGTYTGSTGGAANLAAGVRVLKCVKY